MASVVERWTKPKPGHTKGERRLFVTFNATDRATGRRRKFWTLAPSSLKKEADALCNEIEMALRKSGGMWPEEEPAAAPFTLGAYLDGWLEGRAHRDASPRTVDNYRRSVKLHIRPALGHVRLDQLSRRMVNDFITDLFDRGQARNTIKNNIAPLVKALNDAVRDDLLPFNPASRAEIPKKARVREVTVPTPVELGRILEALRPDARDAVTTIAGLGLRRGEGLALQWRDIDFERGTVHVRRQNIGGVIGGTKTKSGVRLVPLYPSVRSVLEARAKRLGLQLEWLKSDERLLFTNARGGPLEPTNWYRREWLPAQAKAGLGGFRIHDLRHFCITQLDEAGMADKLRSTVAGHGDAEDHERDLHAH